MDVPAVYLFLSPVASQSVVRAGLTGSALPALHFILRAQFAVDVIIVQEGVIGDLAEAVTGRLVAKRPDLPTGAPLLLDATWEAQGGGRYRFATSCDSEPLREWLGDLPSQRIMLQIELKFPDEEDPRLSLPFLATVTNAWSRGDEDAIPDPAGDAAQELLDGATVRYDKAQTLTDEQQEQALANIGMTISGDRVTLPNGKYFYLNLPE